MTKSMTGFASSTGAAHGYRWTWDIRSVNARGLDMRLRVPDWVEGLEQRLRALLQKTVARGSVNLTLKIQRDEVAGDLHVDSRALNRVLATLKHIEVEATGNHNLRVGKISAADILAIPAVTASSVQDQDTGELRDALLADFAGPLAALNDMRMTEGRALEEIIRGQLAKIETLSANAKEIAEQRREATARLLRDNLAKVLENAEGADADRVAQELAIMATKSDVTEEIDRLYAHVAAAHELLEPDAPVGRKLDFLTQEFNREANTLCSKAQSKDLTRTGLELKAIIEQMREQVQNVE